MYLILLPYPLFCVFKHLSSSLVQTAWLLAACTSDSWLPSSQLQRAARLLYLIHSEQIRAPPVARLALLVQGAVVCLTSLLPQPGNSLCLTSTCFQFWHVHCVHV